MRKVVGRPVEKIIAELINRDAKDEPPPSGINNDKLKHLAELIGSITQQNSPRKRQRPTLRTPMRTGHKSSKNTPPLFSSPVSSPEGSHVSKRARKTP